MKQAENIKHFEFLYTPVLSIRDKDILDLEHFEILDFISPHLKSLKLLIGKLKEQQLLPVEINKTCREEKTEIVLLQFLCWTTN